MRFNQDFQAKASRKIIELLETSFWQGRYNQENDCRTRITATHNLFLINNEVLSQGWNRYLCRNFFQIGNITFEEDFVSQN